MTEKAARPGRWTKGQSGNPRGRKPGSGVTQQLRASIAQHVPDIVSKLVEQAKEGDTQAARLLLERVLPPVKQQEEAVSFDLPEGTLSEQGAAVIRAAGDGEIAPSQATQMLTGLAAFAKLKEVDELERRLEALEAAASRKAPR